MLPIWLAQSIDTEDTYLQIEQLYNEYERLLYAVAFRYLRDPYRAEDAVHDTFIRIIGIIDRMEDARSPRTRRFLITVTENICINILKKKSNEMEISMNNDPDKAEWTAVSETYSAAEDAFFEQHELSQVAEAVRQLPIRLRNTLLWYAVDGLSMHEIAEIEECTIEAVKKRIQRARSRLRRDVEEMSMR